MAKYIICDCAHANWGKTTTLLEVVNLIVTNPTNFVVLKTIYHGVDKWVVAQEISTGKIILVQTQGDDANAFNDTNHHLSAGSPVNIIICSSRTKGTARSAVSRIARTYGYETILFRNFCPEHKTLFSNPVISAVNKVNLAQLILDFALAL